MTRSAPLPWFAVVAYGLGDVANSFSFALGLLFLLNYYTDVAGISAAAAGTLLMLVRIYDAVIDVATGHLLDHRALRNRFGRFRPFLLWGGLPLLLLNVAVFSVPAGWSSGARLSYACISYALLGTAYSFVNIPYGSLASVMTQQPRERARLSAARTICGTLSFVFLAFIIGPGLRQLQGEALQAHLTQITLLLAALGSLFYLGCFLATREIVSRPPAPPRWRDSLSTLRRNRPLHLLCLCALCVLTGSGASSASLLYFARYVLGDAGHFPSLIVGTTLVGTLLAVPLAPLLAARIGKTGCFRAGTALAALAHLALWLLPKPGLAQALGLLGLGAFGAVLAMAVMWALEADTVEYGEWQTGRRLEGSNYALFSLTRKCGLALGGSVPAFLLALGHYVPNAAQQSASAQQAILYGLALVPAITFTIASVVMRFYPLTDARFLAMLQAAHQRGVEAR